jgi:hypothetical protein
MVTIDKLSPSLSLPELYSISGNYTRREYHDQSTRRADTALTTDHDPIKRWDAAVSRYLETRKGGPEGNTAKT